MSKKASALRVLHTSDWHLGRMLFEQKRYDEFQKFLDWLVTVIEAEKVNILLVAGDIFDTTTPSNRSLEQYYNFLARLSSIPHCRHIIIIGGNHDSPSLIDTSKTLLKALHVHVVGNMPENPEDEVLLLKDATGSPEMVVCAVPFLRDKDVRTATLGDAPDAKVRKLQEGIRAHYATIAEIAENLRTECGGNIPVVAMGHLYTAGGGCSQEEGERNLYIGGEFQVNANIFSAQFDYVALGHIHSRSRINKSETIRYCGAPLPMGFDKQKRQKSVCLVDFSGREARVREIDVPTFQRLESIKGNRETIEAEVNRLVAAKSDAWLEILYNGATPIGDLSAHITDMVKGTDLKVLRIVNENSYFGIIEQEQEGEELTDLTEEQVFLRLLDRGAAPIPEDEREDLLAMFHEIVTLVEQQDSQAE